MEDSLGNTDAHERRCHRPKTADFFDPLLANRGYLQQALSRNMPDHLDAEAKRDLTAEQLFAYTLVRSSVDHIRAELFAQAEDRRISKRELVVSLLKPTAPLMRPTLTEEV
jgi:hypothetical protein